MAMRRSVESIEFDTVDDLSDEEFGDLLLWHSDRSKRNEDVWERLTDMLHTLRAGRVLQEMRTVNALSILTRKQELEELKNSRLDFFADYDNPLSELSTDRVWTREKSQFDIWLHRAERFKIRVEFALCALDEARRGAGYEDTPYRFWKLIDTVNSFLDGDTSQEDLQDTLDSLSSDAANITGTSHETQVWAPCDVLEDGITIDPRWSDWYEDVDQARKAVAAEQGTVLGTAKVSAWIRAD